MRPLWFKAKHYGWGWYPATWQGWLILVIAIGTIVIYGVLVDRQSHSVSDTLIGSCVFTVIVITLLICVCYLTGEKPKWRWGGK